LVAGVDLRRDMLVASKISGKARERKGGKMMMVLINKNHTFDSRKSIIALLALHLQQHGHSLYEHSFGFLN
jgi:hypothetical protein